MRIGAMDDRPALTGAEAASGGRFRVECWGDFSVVDSASGEVLNPRGRKARALLAFLVLHPGKAISRERLTGLLWGDRGEEQAERVSARRSSS